MDDENQRNDHTSDTDEVIRHSCKARLQDSGAIPRFRRRSAASVSFFM